MRNTYQYKTNMVVALGVVAFLLCILFGTFARAEMQTFSFTLNDPAPDGYRMYEVFQDGRVEKVGDDLVGLTQGTFSIDLVRPPAGSCRTFTLVAFEGTMESDYSQTAPWCSDWEKSVPLYYTPPVRPSAPGSLSTGN